MAEYYYLESLEDAEKRGEDTTLPKSTILGALAIIFVPFILQCLFWIIVGILPIYILIKILGM